MTRSLPIAVALLALAGCAPGHGLDSSGDDGGGGAGPTDPLYPDPDWATGAPGDHGLDPDLLDRAAEVAEAGRSHCLLVIRGGVLVFERYFAATDAETASRSWSLAKSYAGTLVGIAIGRGELGGLDDPIADHLPAWAGGDREAITIRQLVSMTSGLEWSAFQDYLEMATLSRDHTGFALDLEAASGSAWTYHNGAVQLLEPLLRHATGAAIDEYAERHLWSKIGMSATWARDPSGNPTAYANVLASCRDHARFGYLYLREGRWRSESVVPPEWVAEALSPSQPFNRGYGLLFWLNGHEPTMTAMMQSRPGPLVPEAPDDLFAARGFGNQFIDVIPSLDLVIVRLGADPATSFDVGALIDDARFDLHAEILEPILEAIR
jgi:CubicO group peptidase (beta-lactamase class C family)